MGIKGPRSCFSLGADPIRFRAIEEKYSNTVAMVAVLWVHRPMEVHPTHPKIVAISGYCKPLIWRHPHFGIAQNTMNTHIHTQHTSHPVWGMLLRGSGWKGTVGAVWPADVCSVRDTLRRAEFRALSQLFGLRPYGCAVAIGQISGFAMTEDGKRKGQS